MSLSKSRTRAAAAATLALVVAGCGSTGVEDIKAASPPPSEEAAKHPTDSYASEELRKTTEDMQELGHTLATAIDGHLELDGDTADKAAELLDGLDFMLRGHVTLMTIVTHAVIHGKPDDVEAARHTLEENTTSLVMHELGTHYDRETLHPFEQHWKGHVDLVVDYARAAAAKDAAAQSHLRDELRRFAQELGLFVSRDLTTGDLDAAVVSEELTKHVESVLAVVDAQARSPAWHPTVEPAVEHASTLAKTLAGSIDRQTTLQGEVDTQAAELLAELTGGLADHVYVTGYTTRAILHDEPEAFAAASELVGTNTEKLAEIFRTHYGEEVASRFRSLWEHHVTLLFDYTRALRAKDPAGVQHAKEELATFAKEFGELISTTTEKKVEASAVEQRIDTYIEALIEAIRSQSRAASG